MSITNVIQRALSTGMRLSRGHVVGVEADNRLRVRLGPPGTGDQICDVLNAGSLAVPLGKGDVVLVACPTGPDGPGVVLGAIGHAAAARSDESAAGPHPEGAVVPEGARRIADREVVIEAGEELTLRCGEASIRITRDGKIVIRGENILSRAKGTQRIKGGTVAIN